MNLGDELGYDRKIENNKRRIWERDQLGGREQQDEGGDYREREREK